MRKGFAINIRRDDYVRVVCNQDHEKMTFLIQGNRCTVRYRGESYHTQHTELLDIDEQITLVFIKRKGGNIGRVIFYCHPSVKVFRKDKVQHYENSSRID